MYKRIVALCEKNGISGYRLCKDIGISPSVLTDLKGGRKKTISADYASRIAKYFGVSVNYIISGDESQEQETEDFIILRGSGEIAECLEELRRRPETRTLLAATKGMTKEQIEMMANFAKTIRGDDN